MKRPDYAAEPVCVDRLFTQVATRTAWLAGQPTAFVLAATLILAWIGSGPWFGWSDTWQLVVNTATTIATFLMVFLIQNSQNRDAAALQAKLDEVIRARGDRNQATRAISTPAAAAGPIASRNAGRVEGERIATRIADADFLRDRAHPRDPLRRAFGSDLFRVALHEPVQGHHAIDHGYANIGVIDCGLPVQFIDHVML